jgi:glutaredoxin
MKNKRLIIIASVTTIILYFLGILTGYFVQVKILSRTQEELEKVREEFYDYSQNLENVQLEQLYLTTHQGELSCKILVSTIEEMNNNLAYFWSRLPSKLEVYEKYSEVQPEYLKLKRDYTLLSIRTWLLSLDVKEKCGEEIIPALYFYSRDCDDCIEQSYVLDNLKKNNPNFSAFIVDFNLDEPIVKIIKNVYNVTEVPSFVINERLYSGYQDLGKMEKIVSRSS